MLRRADTDNRQDNRVICMLILCMMAVMLSAAACSGIKPKPAADSEHGSDQTVSFETDNSSMKEDTAKDAVSVSCEVHLMMDPELVLDEEHKLKQELCDEFKTKKKYKIYGTVYMETKDGVFSKEGWVNRIRFREDKPEEDFKLTYKKRYPVSGIDINSALRTASKDGFDLSDEEWKSEVEWSYSSMTLSISKDVKASSEGYETIADLTLKEAVDMMKEGMPDEERDWGSRLWGTDTLESSQITGPVNFTRYNGKYFDQKVEIEVWKLPGEGSDEERYITELSYKTDDLTKAAIYRDMMINGLREQGILIEEDSLKTQKILNLL